MADNPSNKPKPLPRLKGLSPLPGPRDDSKAAATPAASAPAPPTNGTSHAAKPAGANAHSNGASTPRTMTGEKPEAAPVSVAPAKPSAPTMPIEQPIVMVQAPLPMESPRIENCWKKFLGHWPGGLQRQGVLITNWDEQVPFASFLTTEEIVMFERRNPDTNGARRLLLSYDAIKGIKITEVVRDKPFRDAGFQGPEHKGLD